VVVTAEGPRLPTASAAALPPLSYRFTGAAGIHAQELLCLRTQLTVTLVRQTGQSKQRIAAHLERYKIFNAEYAKTG
jgi:hypothetical protein